MSDFDTIEPIYRLVETHHGDDLPAVAMREMGDENRWTELVWLNSLIPPYITDDPALSGPGVLLSGSILRVPSALGVYTDDAERGQVYERDVKLTNRKLSVGEDGDLEIVSGEKNLVQQITHRVITPRGQVRRHPEYGCLAWRLHGVASGPVANVLAAEYVKSAIAADYRISSVKSSQAELVGDAITVSANAEAIAGGAVDVVIP